MVMNPSQVRVIDPILTNVAQGYSHPERMIHALFPRVPVPQRGGQIIEFGRESFKRYNIRRAPGSSTKRVQFGYEGKPFALVQDALEGQVPWEFMQDANQVPGIDMGSEAVMDVMSIMTLGLEIEGAAMATDAANYAVDSKETLAGADQFSDDASDPGAVVDDAKETVRKKVGLRPNVMAMNGAHFTRLSRHPKLKEQFKYTSSDSLTVQMLAEYFGVRKLAVFESVYMDQGSTQMQDVWPDSIVLAYVPEQITSMRQPSFGYTYTLTGHPLTEEPYNDRNQKSWIYPVTYERAPVLSGIESGYLIEDILA